MKTLLGRENPLLATFDFDGFHLLQLEMEVESEVFDD